MTLGNEYLQQKKQSRNKSKLHRQIEQVTKRKQKTGRRKNPLLNEAKGKTFGFGFGATTNSQHIRKIAYLKPRRA